MVFYQLLFIFVTMCTISLGQIQNSVHNSNRQHIVAFMNYLKEGQKDRLGLQY